MASWSSGYTRVKIVFLSS